MIEERPSDYEEVDTYGVQIHVLVLRTYMCFPAISLSINPVHEVPGRTRKRDIHQHGQM